MKLFCKNKTKLMGAREDAAVIALAGNPNVGKSTVFNALTGLKQHTGNWAGKTVDGAVGVCKKGEREYLLADIPGTYSLNARSAEEEVARDFICFGSARAVIIVCDATSTQRNLNLVLQTLEVTSRAVVCVNLLDEAERHGIKLDLCELEHRLGVPVVGISARKKRNLGALLDAVDFILEGKGEANAYKVKYPRPIEEALQVIVPELEKLETKGLPARWLSLKLLENDAAFIKKAEEYLQLEFCKQPRLASALISAREVLKSYSLTEATFKDLVSSAVVFAAENLCSGVVDTGGENRSLDRRLDKIFTSRAFGYPVMILLLCLIFWITISGANYPSAWLAALFSWLEERLVNLLLYLNTPPMLQSAIIDGVYRVLSTVVSVMLPPMAIFFPLFTLLEDSGYLPRIAFNLDNPFKNAGACGKQALTMCMGFGCKAVGVEGCRIIDSPRERLLATLTNSFVPCNGRFGALITVLTMFCAASGAARGVVSALLLTAAIVFSVLVTLAVTRILSKTMLRGLPSSFALELPPYRKPQVAQVLIRSFLDRTVFVLGRAVCVAAPAGLIIWLMANVNVGGASLFHHCAAFLDPFARLMGLDGVILIAFILGFSANETVLPIMVMGYSAGGTIAELGSAGQLKELFVSHGWTAATAISVALFLLMHWPCSTTLWAVKKETGSLKYTALAAFIPTLAGVICCAGFNLLVRLFGAA